MNIDLGKRNRAEQLNAEILINNSSRNNGNLHVCSKHANLISPFPRIPLLSLFQPPPESAVKERGGNEFTANDAGDAVSMESIREIPNPVIPRMCMHMRHITRDTKAENPPHVDFPRSAERDTSPAIAAILRSMRANR